MRCSWLDVALAVMSLGWCFAPAPVGAQDPASGSGSPGASSTARTTQPAAPAKPKKIWTNDDVAAASGSNSPATKSKNDSASSSDTNTKLAKHLHDRLDTLEAQLRDTQKQLTDLKNFEAGEGNGTAGRQLHKGYSMEPVPDQIAKLETKRQQLQEQINQVYDEARKKGILPGQLR
jgi:chromosome segregation ATPase